MTGEKQCGVTHFKEVLNRNSADILNPDIAGVGSLVELNEIADLSDKVGVRVSSSLLEFNGYSSLSNDAFLCEVEKILKKLRYILTIFQHQKITVIQGSI